MKLILMRHGDAADASDDTRRPLSQEGTREAELAGELLAAAKESPGLIWHSELLRARQTAEIVARRLGLQQNLRSRIGLRPDDSPEAFVREIEAEASQSDVMIVGHLPFMGELASCLLSNSSSAVSIRFPTGTLLCLERTGYGGWMQRYHLPAKLIARILR